MKPLSETPYWSLIHKINGQLLKELKGLLQETIDWNAELWICNIIILDRKFEDIIEINLHTSATMFSGKIFDKSEEGRVVDSSEENTSSIKETNSEDVWGLNRSVPLRESFTSHSIKTGSVVWVDNIQKLEEEENNPLKDQYRPFKFVSVRSDFNISSEYVFPIRIRISTNETILGVLNMECKIPENEFSKHTVNHQAIIGLILSLLDVHAPFLLITGRIAPKNLSEDVFGNQDSGTDWPLSPATIKSFETIHLETIKAKVENLLARWERKKIEQ